MKYDGLGIYSNFRRIYGLGLTRIRREAECDGGVLVLDVGVTESEQGMPRAIVIDNCAAVPTAAQIF